MALKFYYDLMSHPSRALYILLKTAKVDFVSRKIKLAKGEQLTEEFAAINRFQKVPVIDHNGFTLTESVAIARYLSQENLIPNTLYPKASKDSARVDEFLEWHNVGLRLHCGLFFLEKFLKPFKTKQPPDEQAVKMFKKNMIVALEDFEKYWLSNGTEFVCGNNITVADVFAVCELEQPRLGGYNPMDHFEKIGEWQAKVRTHFNPHYDDAHLHINKTIEILEKVAAQ